MSPRVTHRSSPITHHSSLVTLKRRVRARWLLDRIRLGLLCGLGGGAVLSLVTRLLGYPSWPLLVAGSLGLALAIAVALALLRWPGSWEAARVADGLGLEERVATAIYAAETGFPAAPLLNDEALRALAGLDPSAYPLLPDPRSWRRPLVAGLLLALVVLLPIPALGDGGRQAVEAQTVAAGRKSVQELQAGLPQSPVPEPLARAAAAEMERLEEALAQARSAAEASRAVEEAQERVAALGGPQDYAWHRAVERLAEAWNSEPDLGALARALESRDPQAVERALAELSDRLGEMSVEQRGQLGLALQAGANAARDVPDLAGELRQAAQQLAAGTDGDGGTDQAAGTLDALAPLMAQGAARSGSLQAAQQVVAGLGRVRAELGAPAGSAMAAGGTAAGGAATGSAAGGGAGGGAPASGAGSGGSGTGSGDGGGSGTGSGTGSGAGTGAGGGSGAGTGSGGGSGAGGGGAGSGAGAGGGPSRGQPGSSGGGATTQGGSAAPSNRGATVYERVYAPTLVGGEGGPTVQAPGDAAGAGGETVEMPESAVTLGGLRPYDEVFGQYDAEARQSLSRQPLPPALQGLVQRYFSAIDPGQ